MGKFSNPIHLSGERVDLLVIGYLRRQNIKVAGEVRAIERRRVDGEAVRDEKSAVRRSLRHYTQSVLAGLSVAGARFHVRLVNVLFA